MVVVLDPVVAEAAGEALLVPVVAAGTEMVAVTLAVAEAAAGVVLALALVVPMAPGAVLHHSTVAEEVIAAGTKVSAGAPGVSGTRLIGDGRTVLASVDKGGRRSAVV